MTLDENVSADVLQPRLLQLPGIRRILVFRALRVGDMMCAVPALRSLRATLPGAAITLVGLPWAEQFARRFSRYIDEFIAFPGHPALPEQPVREAELANFYKTLREREFDLAVQMHGSGEISNQIMADFGARVTAGFIPADRSPTASHLPYPAHGPEPLRLLQLMHFLGAADSAHHLEFPLSEQDEREWRDAGLGKELVPGRYLCIHPGASNFDKCWPPEHFAEIGDRLQEEFGLQVVLTGSGSEAALAQTVARHMRTKAVNAAAPISIGAMASLMSRSRLLVCNDTGVSHIAAALQLPSVVIFRNADVERWAPLNRSLHRSVHDPQGRDTFSVLAQARALLQAAEARTPALGPVPPIRR